MLQGQSFVHGYRVRYPFSDVQYDTGRSSAGVQTQHRGRRPVQCRGAHGFVPYLGHLDTIASWIERGFG